MLVKDRIVKIRRHHLHNKHEYVLHKTLLSWASVWVSWVFVMMTVWNVHCGFCRHFISSSLPPNRSEMTITPPHTHTKPQRFQYTNTRASSSSSAALQEPFLTGAKWWFVNNSNKTWGCNRKWNNSPTRRTLIYLKTHTHTQLSRWESARWNANRKWFHWWTELARWRAFKLWLPWR